MAGLKTRDGLVRRALVLEYITVAWSILEAIVAISAGIIAHSIALLGFGLDSVIEVVAAGTLIWRLLMRQPDEETDAERRALRIVGMTFILLAIYVAFESGRTLWLHETARLSIAGIIVTILSAAGMLWLAWSKRRTALALESHALAADATETQMCGYLSLIVLAGLGLNALWGWWWADPVAGLLMVGFLVKEGCEAWEGESCC